MSQCEVGWPHLLGPVATVSACRFPGACPPTSTAMQSADAAMPSRRLSRINARRGERWRSRPWDAACDGAVDQRSSCTASTRISEASKLGERLRRTNRAALAERGPGSQVYFQSQSLRSHSGLRHILVEFRTEEYDGYDPTDR